MPNDLDTGVDRTILADLVLRPDATEVSRSRHVIGSVLQRSGCVNSCDDTELIVCELVANAVEHATSEVRVQVSRAGDTLRVEVHDDGTGDPEVQSPQPLSESGRGLMIVESIAAQWGVIPSTGGGKTVWAEQPW
jgi:anti-sigma regulatory factor (Ser/Thr protein kinase)